MKSLKGKVKAVQKVANARKATTLRDPNEMETFLSQKKS